MLLKQTKIVASISDRRCDVDFIKQLFEAGMNVVRMNTAHASREGFEALIANVRAVSNRIAILMDTKGPEVRTTANAEPIPYKIGEKVKIVGNPDLETTRECIAVSYPNFVSDLNIGGTILIDDGDLELEVIDKTDGYLLCEVKNDATLGSRKSILILSLTLSYVTVRMYLTYVKFWMHIIVILRLLLRLRIRKGWIISMKFWKWQMA